MPSLSNAVSTMVTVRIYPTGTQSQDETEQRTQSKASNMTSLTLAPFGGGGYTPVWSQFATDLTGNLNFQVNGSDATLPIANIMLNASTINIIFGDISSAAPNTYFELLMYVIFEGVTTLPDDVKLKPTFGPVNDIVVKFQEANGYTNLTDGGNLTVPVTSNG